jgi:C4-dicarboxylate transporter DctM subunit
MAGLLIISILVLALIGIPIGFSLGLSSLITLLYAGNLPLIVIPQKMFNGIDSFPILAIPFFILAGDFMNYGGINKKIIRVANAFVGWISGSLAIITIVASMFFAAISGSAVATVSAIGGITIPAMKRQGYKDEFAAAVASSAAIVGPIIPPSIPLIVYGASLQMSVSDLFIASVIPGLIIGFVFLGLAYYIAKKRNFPRSDKATTKEKIESVKDGFAALLMPVIILGGIFSGIFTPTEASVIAVVYSYLISAFIYKSIKFKDLGKIFAEAAVSTSTIMIILAASKVLSWLVVVSNLPTIISNGILGFTDSSFLILLLINIILLIVGCLIEANAAIIILIPVLVPLAASAGMSPLQFGVVMTFNLCLGLLTPPVGATLLIGTYLADAKFEKAVMSMLPFLIAGIIILMLVTYVPALTLWLPGIL